MESSNEQGYVIDIFDNEEDLVENDDPLDGGFCTGSLEAAIQMAADMAITLSEKEPI